MKLRWSKYHLINGLYVGTLVRCHFIMNVQVSFVQGLDRIVFFLRICFNGEIKSGKTRFFLKARRFLPGFFSNYSNCGTRMKQ